MFPISVETFFEKYRCGFFSWTSATTRAQRIDCQKAYAHTTLCVHIHMRTPRCEIYFWSRCCLYIYHIHAEYDCTRMRLYLYICVAPGIYTSLCTIVYSSYLHGTCLDSETPQVSTSLFIYRPLLQVVCHCTCIYTSLSTFVCAQEWTNRTLIGHEPLICSKMCFTKTELVR